MHPVLMSALAQARRTWTEISYAESRRFELATGVSATSSGGAGKPGRWWRWGRRRRQEADASVEALEALYALDEWYADWV